LVSSPNDLPGVTEVVGIAVQSAKCEYRRAVCRIPHAGVPKYVPLGTS
jgi:hypothetical protein